MINNQKGRIDFLIESNFDNNIIPNSASIKKYLSREFIHGVISQQESDFFGYRRPNVIIMDSLSELVDQMFESRLDKTKFLAYYSDINHSESFNNEFKVLGLMPLEGILKSYQFFFDHVNKKYQRFNWSRIRLCFKY